jgi:hypothetical protein
MVLDLTDREAAMLKTMLTSASILSVHSTIDIYKDDYGPLLGKLLNQREQQERRSFKNVP